MAILHPMTAYATAQSKPTNRFSQRRSDILDVASNHINQFGVRGMTLTRIAQDLGIDTSSLTYYFRKREDLAVACLERTLEWQHEAASAASRTGYARSAVSSFLGAHFDVHRSDRPGNSPQLTYLGDIRSISPERRTSLLDRYADSFRLIRECFVADNGGRERAHIAASVVMGCAHWLSVWVNDYADNDFGRIQTRLFELLDRGLGARGRRGATDGTVVLPPREPPSGDALSRFLRAATELINRDGYHGASVEKIAAELGVSTGSFYHHLDNKDELVLACFERHFTQIEATHTAAREQASAPAERLALIASRLLELQLGEATPLMRASAYQALPPDLRAIVIRRTGQASRHIAGIVADGAATGDLQAVDPAVASQFFASVINAASGLRSWQSQRPVEVRAVLLGMLERGIFL